MSTSDTQTIRSREAWFVPLAIVVAGIILALVTYSIRSGHVEGTVQGDASLLRPVTTSDHTIGNPAATVTLVEYADIDSPYSKTFQKTMEQLMSDYASDGHVAWVYRHLPLIDQHIHAEQHAEAAECAASIGGSGMFWRFIDALNAAAPGSQQFDPKNYDSIVSSLGILPQSFDECMTKHTFQSVVSADFSNGLAVGAGGSPFSILLIHGQPPTTINGAIPYDAMKKIFDQAIAKAQPTS